MMAKSPSGKLTWISFSETNVTSPLSSGTDSSKFDSSSAVDLPNVSKQGFWESAMDDVSVNGQNLGFKGRTAILDTGQFSYQRK